MTSHLNAALNPAIESAIDWVVRLDSGTATAAEREAFQNWLASAHEHRTAWQLLNSTLGLPFNQLSDAQRHLPGSARIATQVLRQSATSVHRRKLLGGAALLMLGGLISAFSLERRMPLQGLFTDLHSGTGERKRVSLADGSVLTLNARTTVDVRLSAETRFIRLHQGEVGVQVASETRRPFEVMTAEGSVRTLGARLVVWQQPGQSLISVQQQSVQVQSRTGQTQALLAGQTLRMRRDTLQLLAGQSRRLDAWLDGLLDVEDESLGAVVEALRPYRYGMLRISPAAARLRVFGVFPLDDSDQTLQSLAQVLPIRVERFGPVTLIDVS